jgi:hypothetical protein
MSTVTQISHTHPPGYESLASAVLDGLAAAKRARPPQHVRAPAAPKLLCHDAVDTWTAAHAGTQPVRGWLIDERDDGTMRVIAHSLVRDGAALLDPSFTPDEHTYPFVPHPRVAGGFFALLCRPNPPWEVIVVTHASLPAQTAQER